MKYSAAMGYPARTSPLFGTGHVSHITGVERKNRILSVACYFGLAPVLWFSGVIYQRNRLVNHHMLYSLAFSFTALCALIFDLVTDRIQYWYTVSVWNPTMDEFHASVIPAWLVGEVIIIGLALAVSLFAVAWLISVVGAWRGRTPYIPVIASAASSFRAVQLGMVWTLLVEFVLVLLVVYGMRSVQIANALPQKGDVYILYTQGGYIPVDGLYDTYTPPRWAVTLAFYPLIQAGMKRFGEDGVAVLPLSEASFNEAVQHGRFIFVASHGGATPGGFTVSGVPYQEYLPSNVPPDRVGEQLQYVYFAGCWTGHLESEWRQVLGLDDGTMFDRLSFVDEHMLWAWFKSPVVIAKLN